MVMMMDSPTTDVFPGVREDVQEWPEYTAPNGVKILIRNDQNPWGFWEAFTIETNEPPEGMKGLRWTSKDDFEKFLAPLVETAERKREINKKRAALKKRQKKMGIDYSSKKK